MAKVLEQKSFLLSADHHADGAVVGENVRRAASMINPDPQLLSSSVVMSDPVDFLGPPLSSGKISDAKN